MGYEIVRISSRAAMDAPPEVVLHEKGVKVYACLIPQTYTDATRVWFVSGDNGDEFGQFATKSEALSAGLALIKNSKV